jgi:serine/threonine-protein kinase HipA
MDFLLAVDDRARMGALRFSPAAGGPFLAAETEGSIPPLISLPRLLDAVDHVAADTDTPDDLRLLLAPGSSLGGARPKATILDSSGALAIAKFPSRSDDYDIIRWESLALDIAGRAGLVVPHHRLESVRDRSVLISKRFDRVDARRVPYLSAMSMIGAADRQQCSYLEVADAIRVHGAAPAMDLVELWKRIVFNVLISNVDDHMRNHGFLYAGRSGWRLSPAFDLNPTPTDVKARVLSTCIDLEDATASLDTAYSVSEYFNIPLDQARMLAAGIGTAVAQWRQLAAERGIPRAAIDRMASAFEHRDLRSALGSSGA